jgi:hypothetical protein
MAKISLSRMNVESLIELRDQVDQRLHEHRIEMQKQLERMDRAIAAVGGQRVARGGGSALRGRQSPAEISGSVRRNLGRSWRNTSLACCRDQGWKETRRFSNRQVSAKGTEKTQVKVISPR